MRGWRASSGTGYMRAPTHAALEPLADDAGAPARRPATREPGDRTGAGIWRLAHEVVRGESIARAAGVSIDDSIKTNIEL